MATGEDRVAGQMPRKVAADRGSVGSQLVVCAPLKGHMHHNIQNKHCYVKTECVFRRFVTQHTADPHVNSS